ncbi:MAG: hypothetical protein AAFR38_02705 [Planctomycetota bacterium]
MRASFHKAAAAAAIIVVAGSAASQTVDLNDAVAVVGSGSRQTTVVVDFNSGGAVESIAYDIRYDGTATVFDAIAGIAAADPRAFAQFQSFGFGDIIGGFGFDLDGDGFEGTTVDGVLTSTAPIFRTTVDNTDPLDAGDLYEEGFGTPGNFEGFWSVWEAAGDPFDAAGPGWSSTFGISTTELLDGGYLGLNFDTDPSFSFTETPSIPVATGLTQLVFADAVIPAPGTAAGFAGLALAAVRRRRRG